MLRVPCVSVRFPFDENASRRVQDPLPLNVALLNELPVVRMVCAVVAVNVTVEVPGVKVPAVRFHPPVTVTVDALSVRVPPV